MKSHGITLCVLVLATISFSTLAGAAVNRERSFEFTLAGGISSPTDDYSNIADAGTAYAFGIGFTPRTSITIGLEYGTNDNQFSNNALYLAKRNLGSTVHDAVFISTHIGLYAKFLATERPTTMYARASIGEYQGDTKYRTDQSRYIYSISYTGFLIGVGFQAGLKSHLAAFSEIAYTGFDVEAAQMNSDVQFLVGLQFVMPAH